MQARPKSSKVLEAGTRTGWLYNLYITNVASETEDNSHSAALKQQGGKEKEKDDEGGDGGFSALQLLFQDLEGQLFEASLVFYPYFLVATVDGHEREVEMGLNGLFNGQGLLSIAQLEKEDLGMINHLSGRKRIYLKLSFANSSAMTTARQRVELMVRRNATMDDENPFLAAQDANIFSGDMLQDAAVTTSKATNWQSWVADLREYDMKYHVRVAIDMGVYVGLWYDVTMDTGKLSVVRCDDSKYAPAMPKICAFDIETTKAPLKFPQPEIDQIYMISYMIDGRGFLIVNREIVMEDIKPFEYTPKPEYEGFFETFNEPDEYHLLRRFYDEMKLYNPHVYVTYNGDYFDFPFIHARSTFHGMRMRDEIGFAEGAEGATLNREIPHLDCFYWVKRDSYLPQGSQGLKAVTKYKLGYEPIEVDPEDMLPLAQSHPQKMASYSVSDAVSTYYLYMKYVHPFIFSLCTIIPMPPDDVLRKGSGTLCESLLCVQAFAKNVVFPNKQVSEREKFHNGHLIDTETYIGGRVEALKSGVFRSDIPMRFETNPDVYDVLASKLDDQLKFAIEVENSTKLEDVTNYDEIKTQITSMLAALRADPVRDETPLIYHLDVGAMYPNIILTNRLQPPSMVTPEVCAGCCFYTPENTNRCRRDMTWVWKGEMFTATRHEYERIKAQIETESFAAAAVAKADQNATTKKTYGNRKGNVLEGTTYEKKERPWGKDKDKDAGAGNNYRKGGAGAAREAREALLEKESDKDGDGSDDDGTTKFHNLEDNTRHSMLKKRLNEYSRKAYGKAHDTREQHRISTVCQRENTFFVDTVRLFRDRRYYYKAQLKKWKGFLDKATTPQDVKEGKSRCVQMESLQLAHKCILNSFYGYVMRKGSRWYSMEMAGIVTYLGATLIKMARALVQQLGVTLELDTDGIWCCLPKSFPEDFTFTTKAGKKFTISYPCVMLNKDVADVYTNHQYQDMEGPGSYKIHDECSIYFEVDGPYLAMILPASREEGKGIKKRYAVFHPDGRLAELKGFELKRRGELMLIKDFQSLVFKRFLDGKSLVEAFGSAAEVANNALDLLYNQGEGYNDEEVLEKLTESSNMSRRLIEYPESQKSLALTTARRIAEFLGPQMVKDKGLACHFVISRTPVGKPVTDRAIPLNIFKADPAVRIHFLRKWTGDQSLPADVGLKAILDWEYYIGRFQGTIQKIITIPAAFQGVNNPVPRVRHPDWLHRRLQQQASRFKQISLTSMFGKMAQQQKAVRDLEDMGGATMSSGAKLLLADKKKSNHVTELSSDDEADDRNNNDDGNASDEEALNHRLDAENLERERIREEQERVEKEQVKAYERKYFAPKSKTALDNAFFGHSEFSGWLKKSKAAWSNRAKLRSEIFGQSAAAAATADSDAATDAADGARKEGGGGATRATLDSMLIDARSKALTTPWHIMEVRPIPHRNDMVTVFALLERTVNVFTVHVDWTVIVDADPQLSSGPIEHGKAIAGRVLPRRADAGQLYEVNVPSGQGVEYLDTLQTSREDIRHVYEGHIPATTRFITQVGAVVSVDSKRHLAAGHRRGEFAVGELDMSSSTRYLHTNLPSVFIFHALSDTRGVMAAVYRATGEALVVIVQPASTQRPNITWPTFVEEALGTVPSHMQAANKGVQLNVTVQYVTDAKAGHALIHQSLLQAMESGPHYQRPSIAAVQSCSTLAALANAIPQLHQLPVLRTLGGVEDEKIFGAHALNWARPLCKRMLVRYFAAGEWVEERMGMASVTNVPLCNLQQDASVSALDFMYSRMLKRHSHVLWSPQGLNFAAETIEEPPREVIFGGAAHSWLIEFSIQQVEVVSVLFSQALQEADDPRAAGLMPGDVTSHFHVLREMLSELYGLAANRKEAAATLLMAFPRWLRDTMSSCYEPNLVALIGRLVHRVLTALLIRIVKIGGRIVRATPDRVIVATNKHSLHDTMGFSAFALSSLRDQPMLNHLNLTPSRFWCPTIMLDHRDYCGLFLPASQAAALTQHSLPDAKAMVFEMSCSIWSRLQPVTRQLIATRLEEIVGVMATVKREVIADLDRNPTTTLATRGEQLSTMFVERLAKVIEEQVQMTIITDVNTMMGDRVQLANATSLSDTAAALEYAKVITQFLSHIADIGPSALRVRNNCLRLCGIGAFATEASYIPDTREKLLYVKCFCSYCSDECTLYVGPQQKQGPANGPANAAPNTASSWKCESCSTPIRKELLEARLLSDLNRTVNNHNNADLQCSKCKRISSSLIANNCCGVLRPKESKLGQVIDVMQFVSRVHNMPMLAEATTLAMASM